MCQTLLSDALFTSAPPHGRFVVPSTLMLMLMLIQMQGCPRLERESSRYKTPRSGFSGDSQMPEGQQEASSESRRVECLLPSTPCCIAAQPSRFKAVRTPRRAALKSCDVARRAPNRQEKMGIWD